MPRHVPQALARAAVVLIAAPLLAAFETPQSALDPAGREAEVVASLTSVLWIGAAVLWTAVMLIAAFVIVRKGRHPERWGNALIWGGGVILPVTVLAVLLPASFAVLADIRIVPQRPAETVEVRGHLWWWEFVYDSEDYGPVVTANEFVVPVGEPVEVILHSDNVNHSFWIPSFAGKMDLIPGRVNRMVIEATRPGLYRGQCAEYCGASHAWMAFAVRALPRDEYDEWLANEAAPYRAPPPVVDELPGGTNPIVGIEPVDGAATSPVAEAETNVPLIPALPTASGPSADEVMREGLALFLASGCGACHAIRGTEADGELGPDLTHVGSRRTLAAGLLPNNVGTMAGWIANARGLKPDARMPSFNTLSGPELRLLATFLSELE